MVVVTAGIRGPGPRKNSLVRRWLRGRVDGAGEIFWYISCFGNGGGLGGGGVRLAWCHFGNLY